MATNWIILDVTSVLKSDDTPRANESYRYREPGLSQQACVVLSEISSCVSCWNVEDAYSNLLCTVVMEEGHQKSKRLSYTAKFKREVIRCTEEKGNRKAVTIFGVNESNVRLWRNTTQWSVGVRCHKGNSLDPRKDDFLKLMMQSSRFFFFKSDTSLDYLWVMIYFERRR
jgi:hypothetical protein